LTSAHRRGWRPLARWIIAISLVGPVAFGFVASWVAPDRVIGIAQRSLEALNGLGFRGVVAFTAVQILVAVSGVLPASLLAVAAGAIYGFLRGFLLAATAILVGAILSFFLSRSLFRPAVERLTARRPRLRNLDSLIDQDGWKLVCLLRISPIMPFSATSFALGLSRIGPVSYMLGTLASLPTLCGYVFAGTLADTGLSVLATGAGPIRWGLLGIGAVATLLLTLRLGQIGVKLGLAPSVMDHLYRRQDQTPAPLRDGGRHG
jgi:uncharacterized membrane protein YdjX (TVP38/TMEM64 family)